MKKYNINQEIPVPPPMQEPGDTGSPLEHMLSSIDHQHEFSEEDRRLTAQIEAVRLLATRLESLATSSDSTCEKIGVEKTEYAVTGARMNQWALFEYFCSFNGG